MAQAVKRVRATLLDSFPTFATTTSSQQLQGIGVGINSPCSDRQQPSWRRESRRDQSSRAKVRRVPCAEDQLPSTSYDPEYLEHCYADECKCSADWRYLTTVQPEVDAHKRLVLVDWMVEVVDEFKLGQATLFLAVNLVDRYLSRRAVRRSALQLLGVTALWLACKFEEVYPPTLGDFVDVTQGSCSGRQLIDMESSLLSELGFGLMVPTAVTFLSLYLPAAAANAADADAFLSASIDADGCDSDGSEGALGGVSGSSSSSGSGGSSSSGCSGSVTGGGGGKRLPCADAPTGPRAAPRYPYPIGGPGPSERPGSKQPAAAGCLSEFPRRVAHMAEYLAELSLLTPECLRFAPSLVAAASLRVACSLLGAPPGARARLAPAAELAAARSGPGGEERLRACMVELRHMFAYAADAARPPAVKAKYCSSHRGCVAMTPIPQWLPDT